MHEQKYLPLLGLFEGSDAENEASHHYIAAVFKYPDPVDCADLKKKLNDITLEIDAIAMDKLQATSAKASGRPQTYTIQGYTKRQTELKEMYNQMNCKVYFDKEESAEFLASQDAALQAANKYTTTSTKTTTYIVIGMIGLVVIASAFLILRKK